MSQPILSLVSLLLLFRTAFTEPGFYRFFVVSVGWLATPGRHAVTAALVALGLSGVLHHAAFHSFFAVAAWSADHLGELLFAHLLSRLPDDAVLSVIIDDTANQRRGRRVFGTGVHHDAVRSTHKHKVLLIGHCWVVLSLLVHLPGMPRPYALPLLFRLYRNKDTCPEDTFKTKLQLAREMLDQLLRWAPGRRIHLMLDGAYCTAPMLADLPDEVVVFGRMRVDAVLTGTLEERLAARAPGTPGRRPQKGLPRPKPKAVAADPQTEWSMGLAQLYGVERVVQFAEQVACWPAVLGQRLLKVVVVRPSGSGRQVEAFFCTDPSMAALSVLEGYSLRWPTEVTFHDLKQFLGFGEIQGWTEWSVKRMVPWVGLLYGVVVLWFHDIQAQGVVAVVPVRPWYRQRRGPSFEDMLRTLQHTLRDPQFLQVLASSEDFNRFIATLQPRRPRHRRVA